MVTEVAEEMQVVTDKSTLAEKFLEAGCEEYNNMALDLAAKFKPLIKGLSQLNEHTIAVFERTPDEVHDKILPLMQPLYDSCIRNINRLKASPVANALSDLILEFEDEASQLMENLTDIQMAFEDDSQDLELQALLSDL